MKTQTNTIFPCVLNALENIQLNEPDKIIDLYGAFKCSGDPEVFINNEDNINEVLQGYTPAEVLQMVEDYDFFGHTYAKFEYTLVGSNDVRGLIDLEELAYGIAESGVAPSWFEKWIDDEDLRSCAVEYIKERRPQSNVSGIRSFLEDYPLSINDDFDDVLDDWDDETETDED